MSTGRDPQQSPTTLELLWGRREPQRRGPKPRLSVERIVEAAIAIADREGIESLSMQHVAQELGYTTMALYRHVQSKDQMLDLMFDAGSGRPPPAPDDASPWRVELEQWVQANQGIYQRHPWMLRVRVSGPPLGPNNLAWMEAGLRPLRRSGLRGFDCVEVLTFISAAVREFSRIEDDMRRQMRRHGLTVEQMDQGYVQALHSVVDTGPHPTLAALLAEGAFDSVRHPTLAAFTEPSATHAGPAAAGESEIAFALERLLDGIEAHVHRSTETTRADDEPPRG